MIKYLILNDLAFKFQYYKKPDKDQKMKTVSVNQTVVIKGTSPHDLYEILMDSKKHAKLVNSTAEISREKGGKFKVYDGYISGTNLELIADTKIVQHIVNGASNFL